MGCRRQQKVVENDKQNRAMYQRLVGVKSVMKRSHWEKDYDKHLAHMRHMCNMPCVLKPAGVSGGFHDTIEDRDVRDDSGYDDGYEDEAPRRREPKFGRRSQQSRRQGSPLPPLLPTNCGG